MSEFKGVCPEIQAKVTDALESMYLKGYNAGQKDTIENARNDLKAAYEKGLMEAWECARIVALSPDKGGMTTGTLCNVFGITDYEEVFAKYSADEVIRKLQTYNESILVGDEVVWGGDTDFPTIVIITAIDANGYFTIDRNGVTTYYSAYDQNGDVIPVHKTGRHFGEVATLIQAMQD